MASFTGVGDNTTLQASHKGDIIDVDISGTYDMTIALQREEGSPSSGAWTTLKTWDTANATVAYKHTTTRLNEMIRLIVQVDTSGTATATLTDNNDKLLDKWEDESGFVRARFYEDGPIFYNKDGTVVFDGRQAQKFVELTDANATLSAANSGKTHLVNNVSADRTFTLPAAAAGLSFKFVAEVGAADGHDWIIVADSATGLYTGGVLMVDTDAGPATVAAVVADQSNDITLQVNVPQGGTWVQFDCVDGTTWAVSGIVVSTAAAVFS